MSYKNIINNIKSLNLSKKDKIISIIVSIIFSLLAILGPLTILINLLVLTRYLNLLYFLIALTACSFVYLAFMFYYKFISENKIKGIYFISLIKSILFWIIIFIILIIVYSI